MDSRWGSRHFVERLTRNSMDAAPLFPGVDRWQASASHRDACNALGIDDYRLHDTRKTYAVRAIRAGASMEFVASQLGHANTQMVVNVYGRFSPPEDEKRGWEHQARLQDAARVAKRA